MSTISVAPAALRHNGALPELRELLANQDASVRLAGSKALGECGTRDSLSALAAVQVHDETIVSLPPGINMIGLNAAASAAAQAIRARVTAQQAARGASPGTPD